MNSVPSTTAAKTVPIITNIVNKSEVLIFNFFTHIRVSITGTSIHFIPLQNIYNSFNIKCNPGCVTLNQNSI